MKIALAQLNYHIGDFEQNTARICDCIDRAKAENAALVVFAELAICGYPPRDFLEFNDFIDRCQSALKLVAEHCKGIAAIIGCPTVNPDVKGKALYNSAALVTEGRIVSLHHKALLPTYDVFDEYRYFEPGRVFNCVNLAGKKLAISVCEDLWNIGDDPMYVMNPMDELAKEQPDLIINIAASPFHYHQAEIRTKILRDNAQKYNLPVVYVNHVGAQTELLFDGGSMVMTASGKCLEQLAFFEEDFAVVELFHKVDNTKVTFKPQITETTQEQRIHDALVMGIRDYFGKLGFEKAILGLSGGIDSALTLVLAARALGPENVRAVLLPSQFSSQHSVDDALALVNNLGCPHDLIPIQPSYESMEASLKPYFDGTPFNIAEENIQARLRAVILMALSNKFGYILLNTSNKSEAAVGYGTLYGDMCGGISVLGDVYKTQVYRLAHYVNREGEVIPENTILKPPSAELRPGQKDSDSLPDYDILDKILFEYIENRKGPNELVALGFDVAMVKRVCRLVNTSEYKRHQTPPILRVSPKAFGMGRRLPIVARYLS
jgi:NAD+ synthase (glutamine-hydrolysing)